MNLMPEKFRQGMARWVLPSGQPGSLRLRQGHPAQKVGIAWVGADGIPRKIHFDGSSVLPEIAVQHHVFLCPAATHNEPFAVS
jgi:hypothetical protein